MFKKLKDKLAEEVKSSPQRIQQFAQAAQAAVTSASSSISDITNSDLFSIGDNDSQQSHGNRTQSSSSSQQNTFQDVSLVQPLQSPSESTEYMSSHDILVNQRQRRLSDSSFASDVSFRLPSYETPSMYHLQSDVEVSASEAEERGFSSGAVSLDRVTKEQLYAAYRRTQERYTKYRTQYGDLARHYKLLERENAKARSVLVETQDKALRRISELREQCTLEQGAKAHLEKALRMEIEEKNMNIEALKTKVQLLQSNPQLYNDDRNENSHKISEQENDGQLINLANDNEVKSLSNESTIEITTLNNKIEKMDHLLNKYKELLKTSKEKNSQVTTEVQILSNDLENKNKEIEKLKNIVDHLAEAKHKIQELSNLNEELQNKINVYEFNKTREQSTLEIDLEKAQEKIAELSSKIEVFTKREEEYAISLAENKLSIHKELESKESEIKSLKDKLEASNKEINSLKIVVNDFKNSVSLLESERTKLTNDCNELALSKTNISELETKIQELSKKYHSLEQSKSKAEEEYKCLQLQLKQETAEKLAMIDRNMYLENRIVQLSEENTKKSLQIIGLENEFQTKVNDFANHLSEDSKKEEIQCELDLWKDKYAKLESEIQEEREELIKLQSEIEKLLTNHESLQTQNIEYREIISDIKAENLILKEKIIKCTEIGVSYVKLLKEVKDIKSFIKLTSNDARSFLNAYKETFTSLAKQICDFLNYLSQHDFNEDKYNELKIKHTTLETEINNYIEKNNTISEQLSLLVDENNKLQTAIHDLELEKKSVNQNVLEQREIDLVKLNSLNEQNKDLACKVTNYEAIIQNLQKIIDSENEKYLSEVGKINILQDEKHHLEDKIQKTETGKTEIYIELDKLKAVHKKILEELDVLKKERDILLGQIKELDYSRNQINKLEEDIKNLRYENIHLKGQAENISGNYKNMEVEIDKLRTSQAEIEAEKNRLNEIIEKLESRQNASNSEKYIQTDDLPKQTNDSLCINSIINDKGCETLPVPVPEVLDSAGTILDAKTMYSVERQEEIKVQHSNELSEKYNSLKLDYEILREENRRYKSDIEGLQTYLTKISKENSVLNDKLRESIATSENSSDNNDITSYLAELKKEVQISKDKLDDLLRENNLLIEENLELKDQLHSQNYSRSESKPNNEKDKTGFEEKYNNLLHLNNTLESRLLDLEQMNRSVNLEMIQMQEKNEKLRLSNEKLETKLDEALVSLRHLHSLEENTEHEYLRNILYEYLTGSGAHSITLAKVLAAIVKFDDLQTKMVLQKEKERQGLLRQLGII